MRVRPVTGVGTSGLAGNHRARAGNGVTGRGVANSRGARPAPQRGSRRSATAGPVRRRTAAVGADTAGTHQVSAGNGLATGVRVRVGTKSKGAGRIRAAARPIRAHRHAAAGRIPDPAVNSERAERIARTAAARAARVHPRAGIRAQAGAGERRAAPAGGAAIHPGGPQAAAAPRQPRAAAGAARTGRVGATTNTGVRIGGPRHSAPLNDPVSTGHALDVGSPRGDRNG